MCKIYSKLTINTPEQRHWHKSGVFIIFFEQISHTASVFEQINAGRTVTNLFAGKHPWYGACFE